MSPSRRHAHGRAFTAQHIARRIDDEWREQRPAPRPKWVQHGGHPVGRQLRERDARADAEDGDRCAGERAPPRTPLRDGRQRFALEPGEEIGCAAPTECAAAFDLEGALEGTGPQLALVLDRASHRDPRGAAAQPGHRESDAGGHRTERQDPNQERNERWQIEPSRITQERDGEREDDRHTGRR
jgi:hypothetical protein